MRVLATGVAVLLLVACGGKSKAPATTPGSGSASASASAVEHTPGALFPHDDTGGDTYGGIGYGGDQYGGDQYGGDAYGGAPTQPTTVTVPAHASKVTVISKGKGKKAKLAYALAAGGKQSVEGTYDMDVKTNSMGNMVIPTLVAHFDEQVVDVGADGAAHLKLTLAGLAAKDRTGQTMDAASFAGFLDASIGTTIETTLTPDGRLGDQTITAPAGGDVAYMQQLTVPTIVFPTDKVGVGAKWKVVTTAADMNGVSATTTTTYTLVAHKGKSMTIAIDQTLSGPPQTVTADNMQMQVTKAEGTTTGKVVLDGSGRMPTGSVSATVTLAFTMDGKPIETSTSIASTLTATQ